MFADSEGVSITLSKLLVKSNAKVDVLPSDSLYCVFKFARTCGGNAPPVNITVLPDEDPEKFAENVVPVAGLSPIVSGSTFAITLILQEGPAS